MTLENPFLLRETRQLFHRPRPLRLWCRGATVSAALYLWWVFQIGPQPGASGSWPPESLLTLIPLHAALCVLAGLYGANRVFAEEHRRSTLEGLFLLPMPPGRWLAAKLVFPVLLVALAWAAGLPFYLVAATLQLTPAAEAQRATLPALLSGLAVLPVILLLPPDYRERLQALESDPAAPSSRLDGDMLSRLLLPALAALALAWAGGPRLFGLAGRPGWIYLYSAWVPEWVVCAGTLLPFVCASALTARATVSRTIPTEMAASRARVIAAVALYFFLLGLSSAQLPAWAIAALATLPVVILVGRAVRSTRRAAGRARRRDDPRTREELEWIARRWDDALLIRDLRVYGQFRSIRSALLWRGIPAAAFIVGQAALLGWASEGRLRWSVQPMAWVLGGILAAPLVLLPAIQASQSWLKERRAETMPMLLLTPMQPERMVSARLTAGTLYYGIVYSPVLLVLLAAATTEGARAVGPMLLAIAPQWYAGILAVETAERTESPAPPGTEVTAISLLLVLGSLACVVGTTILGVTIWSWLPIWQGWVCAACIAGLGVVIAQRAMRLRAEQLRALRESGQGGGDALPGPGKRRGRHRAPQGENPHSGKPARSAHPT